MKFTCDDELALSRARSRARALAGGILSRSQSILLESTPVKF